ncbi:MAG: hypothetical protein AAGA84_01120, partial [Pseudomonadota bacterium]
DPDVVFPPLDAYWSVNNTPNVGTGSIDNGEIGTSFYRGDIDSLFLLGDEDVDTEEFDIFVVAHEWGHYFEDTLSRSDSTGGSHNFVQYLDPRLAFGEGFGNAVSAMINDGSIYYDTLDSQQAGGFQFDLENNDLTAANRGWFSERSVQAILYDIFDSNADTGDTLAVGFTPIYEVLVGAQANGVPFTTIFPFVEAFKAENPASAGALDSALTLQRISTNSDGYGNNETEGAGRADLTLPIYTTLTLNAAAVEVCSSNAFDPGEAGNKLAVRQYLRFSIPVDGNYTISVVTNNPPAVGSSDPDALVYQGQRFITFAQSGVANQETINLPGLTAGDYAMDVYEFSYRSGAPAAIAQPNDRTCFDITLTN